MKKSQLQWWIGLVILCCSPSFAAPFVTARNAQCVAFSNDGKRVAIGMSGMSNDEFPPRPHPSPRKCGVVQIYDVETRERHWRSETFGDLTRVRFSPDGKLVALSRLYATADGIALNSVLLLDATTGKRIHEFDRCYAFDFSPTDDTIAVLSRTKCLIFDTKTRSKLRQISALKQSLAIRFSPDGKHLAGIVADDNKFRIAVCGSNDGQVIGESIELDAPFYLIEYSPDGNIIASGHKDSVILWDASSMLPKANFSAGRGVHQPFFSPNGGMLATTNHANGDAVFWNLATEKELRRYTFQRGGIRTYYRRKADDQIRPEDNPQRYAFLPDGTAFLSACYGGMMRLLTDGRDLGRFEE